MTSKSPHKPLDDMESSIGIFEEAVSRAEALGKAAREAAEASSRTSQVALSRAEEISRDEKQAAEE